MVSGWTNYGLLTPQQVYLRYSSIDHERLRMSYLLTDAFPKLDVVAGLIGDYADWSWVSRETSRIIPDSLQ